MAAVSDKLAALCKEGGRVVVRNITFEMLEKAVRFIYYGKIELDKNDVGDLRDGLDLLKVKIVIENNASDEVERVGEGYMDRNDNLFVQNSFTLTSASRVSQDLWSQNKKMIKIENPSIVERNQDSSVTVSDTNGDASYEEVGMSFSKILDSFSKDKMPAVKETSKLAAFKKPPLSPHSRSELQRTRIMCDYCSEEVMYKSYTKHCMNHHPEAPWDVRKACGTCKSRIPAVSFKFHLEVFGHEEAVVEQVVKYENVKTGNSGHNEAKKTPKAQTKILCDYCEEQVTLAKYVDHCKKLHSISDADERCHRKCYKCGVKLHIIAEKFHHEIYHPAIPKHTSGKVEPLKIVAHNKTLTKVPCEFCSESVVFGTYKSHVKNKHPEIAYAEQVKCSKCGVKLPKINFKFHHQIFHHSSKLAPHPIAISPSPLPSLPRAKVPCAHCNVKIKPHRMFLHVKNKHGKETDIGHSGPEVTDFSLNKDANIEKEDVDSEASDEDVAMGAQGDIEQEGGQIESTVLRVSSNCKIWGFN